MPETEQPPGKTNVPLVILLVAVAVIAITVAIKRSIGPKNFSGLAVGETATQVTGAGWLNGPGPTTEALKGKVVVIEAWASW